MRNNFSKLNQSAQYIKGVGPKKLKLLEKLKIFTIKDLLYYFPRRYEDRSNLRPISKVTIGNFETVKGKVLACGNRRTRHALNIFHLALSDNSGIIYGTWFNQPYLKERFKIGDEVILYGKVERFKQLQINSPEYEILKQEEDDEEQIHTGRIVPVYPLTANISQRYLRTIAKRGVDRYLDFINEFLPFEILKRNRLLPLKDAISRIHFPNLMEEIEDAKQRLIFDEFFFLELTLALIRKQIKEKKKIKKNNFSGVLIEKFKESLPFELTLGQKKVISEIEADLITEKPMNRLLQGDVGSGKTIVSVWAMVLAIQNGFQVALMAPTEILAVQHYQTLEKYLEPLGIKTALLTSALKRIEKEKLIFQIKAQQIDIVVGTHALIQAEVEFKNLGLVVVDEQHKFGVMQKIKLQQKAFVPDVLVMSATPIPRTLAITFFGDLDISTIKELPPGRTKVLTYWINEKKRNSLYEFLRKKIRENNQVYVVYPVVEKSKLQDLKAATKMYEHFKNEIFPEFRVGLIHGRLKEVEKNENMNLFKNGQLDILVATTVIEVGIDVPNASVMLIEHAERFGLSQLHQLRGRVGRGQKQAYCILLSEAKTAEAKQRLSAMTKTTDGFKIAEYDLLIRGPGEFFGTRQHGLPELKIGNLLTDREILNVARKEAFSYLEKNPNLIGKEGTLLNGTLNDKFPQNKEFILAR